MLAILKNLFQTIKKITDQFPEEQKAISFLIATGLHHQGATTVLKQAQMQHIQLDEEYPLQLFYNKNGIILELNQTWASMSEVSLTQLFKKLNRCHRKLRISGFLFFLDITQLMLNDDDEQTLQIKKHSQHYHQFIAALDYPVRAGLIITKLDQITGFTDFFQMAHELELQEPLGFSLSYAKAHLRFANIFSDSWGNFVAHLNQMMIQKVHTTRANKKRILIREFPLQIALLESRFLKLVKNISQEKGHIHNIYFTSSEQKGRNINYLNQKIEKDFSMLVPISSVQSVNYKHFFIHGAVHHTQELSSYTPKPSLFKEKSIQFLLTTGVLLSSYVLFQTIRAADIILTAKNQLTHLENSYHQSNINELLALESSYNNLNQVLFIFKYINNVHMLKEYIYKLEKIAYKNQMSDEFSRILETECKSTNLAHSYSALKVYKAIQEKRHDQTDFIIKWFEVYWSKSLSKKNNRDYQLLLRKFIWEISWPIDNTTILNTQNYLKSISQDYLAFEVINQQLTIDTELVKIEGFDRDHLVIPKCFLKENFKPTEKKLFTEFTQLERDGWVLGVKVDPALKNQLLELYAKKYIRWWQNINQNIHPRHFNSFTEAKNIFETYIHKNSFDNLVALINRQTELNMDEPNDDFNRLVANAFSNSNFVVNSSGDLQRIWKDLEKFSGMFIALNDRGQASFQYLRSYFNQTQFNDALYTLGEYAKRMPEPTKTWLNQIQEDMWLLIQNSTKQYLNQRWHEQIYSGYEKQIDKHYPFYESIEEISMSEFESFFAPNGNMQHFFRDYLQPFINTSQAQWIVKEVDSKKFPIPDNIIQKFIQANIITNMFFPNNASHCEIQFSLEKMTLDPVVGSLLLKVGHQEIKDSQKENLYMQDLHWPETGATLEINTIDGQKYQLTEIGSWAFFRLLEKINVLNDPNDPGAMQILLEINGNSGRYLLKTASPINPFMPSIFKDFILTDKLIP